jgi:hypothetical protein
MDSDRTAALLVAHLMRDSAVLEDDEAPVRAGLVRSFEEAMDARARRRGLIAESGD